MRTINALFQNHLSQRKILGTSSQGLSIDGSAFHCFLHGRIWKNIFLPGTDYRILKIVPLLKYAL